MLVRPILVTFTPGTEPVTGSRHHRPDSVGSRRSALVNRIGAIYRGEKVIIPDGATQISPKDRVIIFVTADRVRQVEQMFRVSLEFF